MNKHPDRTEYVYLSFLKYDEQGSILERFLLYMSSCVLNNANPEGYIHVEIIIPTGKLRYAYYSSSKPDIKGNTGVKKMRIDVNKDSDGVYFYTKRNKKNTKFVDRDGYNGFISVRITEEEKDELLKFLNSKIGKKFNDMGWLVNYIPIMKNLFGPIDKKGEEYTCSELVWDAFQVNFI